MSRETVNRWIRQRNTPVGENLLRVLSFTRRLEPAIEARDLFPLPSPRTNGDAAEDVLNKNWGSECVLCEVPWDAETEHLPLAILDPDLGDDPIGDLCESCAARVADDDFRMVPTDDSDIERGFEP